SADLAYTSGLACQYSYPLCVGTRSNLTSWAPRVMEQTLLRPSLLWSLQITNMISSFGLCRGGRRPICLLASRSVWPSWHSRSLSLSSVGFPVSLLWSSADSSSGSPRSRCTSIED
ncbi:unnamed protein product, partial [Penicillium nalgiovense]